MTFHALQIGLVKTVALRASIRQGATLIPDAIVKPG
jgi:hypothetical protein